MRDASIKGRISRGEKHSAILRRVALSGVRNPMARLSAQQVIEIRIRRAAGELASILASEFNVSKSTIEKIEWRQTWSHI